MTEPHLSDDRLIEICSTGSGDPPERAHLSACASCERRRRSVVQILAELDDAATAEADAAFPPDRLVRQQARILTRVEQDGRPGRLIAFPADHPPAAVFVRSRSRTRVAAAVAAAAFLMGALAGHLAHELPLRDEGAPTDIVVVTNDANAVPLRAVSTTFSEDEFLGQIEVAAANGPAALRPLDAMTPRAWDDGR